MSLIVKKYRHGGALGGVLPDLFPGAGRMLDDLRAGERARRHGVPCAPAACLVLKRRFGVLWSGYLFSEEVVGGVSLARSLERARSTPPEVAAADGPPAPPLDPAGGVAATGRPEMATRVAEGAVRTVRALHDAGIVHRDLNLGNLLVRGGETFVIDLDGARIVESPSALLRFENLARLDRSYTKIFGEEGGPLSHHERRSLLAIYCGGDDAMLRTMEANVEAHKRSLRRHAVVRGTTARP